MRKSKMSNWWLICLVTSFIMFTNCSKNSYSPQIVQISSELNLNSVIFDYSKISNLKQPTAFIVDNDSIFLSQYLKDKLFVYSVFETTSGYERLFRDSIPIGFDHFAMLLSNELILSFKSHENDISFIREKDDSTLKTTIRLPKYYDDLLHDSIQLVVSNSVGELPQLKGDIVLFRSYQQHSKQPNSLENGYVSMYESPIFLAYNLRSKQFYSFSKLSDFGFHYDPRTMNLFARNDIRFSSTFAGDTHYLIHSAKSEKLFFVDHSGQKLDSVSYNYAQHSTDFTLNMNDVGDASQYIIEASFYAITWYYRDSNKIVRVLKRGKTDDSQKGQKETPWEVVIIDGDKGEVSTVLKFAPNQFDYGDVHFVKDRYLFVSNKGIENKKYDPQNHSYSIIDLADFLD